MERWKIRKEQFKCIAEDTTRYDQNGREVAKLAVAQDEWARNLKHSIIIDLDDRVLFLSKYCYNV